MKPNGVSGQAKPSAWSVSGGCAISPAASRCGGLATSVLATILGLQTGVTPCALAVVDKPKRVIRVEVSRTRQPCCINFSRQKIEHQGRLDVAVGREFGLELAKRRTRHGAALNPALLAVGLFQRCHVDDEAIFHITFQQTFV